LEVILRCAWRRFPLPRPFRPTPTPQNSTRELWLNATPEHPIGFQSIVYATDYSPEAAKACVSALPLAQHFGAQVYVCHVLPDPEDDCDLSEQDLNDQFVGALRDLVSEVSPEWADLDCVLDYEFAADGILLIAQRVKANLIVLGTRRTPRCSNSFGTGLGFQVISGSSCPVLSIQG
jgi:nucleotide-binding universal stress UspA family protein